MRPFWSYFGGKWRIAPRYPKPAHARIVEPFAGAAGYSVRHYMHDVVLVEKDARLAAMWRYLIASTPYEIRRLPLVKDTRDLPAGVPPEAALLIGFNMNQGAASPTFCATPWGEWSHKSRERLAWQVGQIKHWRIVEGDYSLSPRDTDATWFVDPPYQAMGRSYKHSSKEIDYGALGTWCKDLPGQVIVCENVGAEWLPFRPLLVQTGSMRSTIEVIWTK